MKSNKKNYVFGAWLFSFAFVLIYYLCNIDLAPWGIEPNQKISDSLSADEAIVKMAHEGNVKKISLKCGLTDNLMHIVIELNGDPTIVNDSKVWYMQHGACIDNYFTATFLGNKILWSGFLKNDSPYEDSLIMVKSAIKGHLAKAQAYAMDRKTFKEGWKIK